MQLDSTDQRADRPGKAGAPHRLTIARQYRSAPPGARSEGSDVMAKGGNKKRGRKKKEANHGKRPNS